MEILRTYDIWRMIDENKEEMVGKRYVQVGGLLQDDFDIGDIAVVTEYCGITSLGSEKHSKIRLSWNGFEKWKEVKEPVSFMEAVKAFDEGKNIYCMYADSVYHYKHMAFRGLKDQSGNYVASYEILRGKWYIE